MPTVVIISLLLGGAMAAQVGSPGPPWQEAPTYLALLAPAGDRAIAYRVYISPHDLETTLRALDADHSLVRAPGAWQARPVLPADAFGQAGRYDRSALARVYGSQQPRVARGARTDGGSVVESWTLIGPYPDTSLSRLHAGTLLVVLRLP